MQQPARIAIDLGAESCRVALLRWSDAQPNIQVIHRGPCMHWPRATIIAGIETGLRKAAEAAPEGIASIAVDSGAWTMSDLLPTAPRSATPVEIGHPESATIGNFAVQLACSEANGQPLSAASVREWAHQLCKCLKERQIGPPFMTKVRHFFTLNFYDLST